VLPSATPPVTDASDTRPYFHAESLRLRFIRDIADARLEKRIDDQEQQWLLTLTQPSPQPPDSDPARIDRLVMGDDSPVSTEMSAALLISHLVSTNTRIYLSTLLYGLEGFDDRQHLLTTLEQRFAQRGAIAPTLEYELLEGLVFEQRMLMIIRQQADKLGAMADQLSLLPTFQNTMAQALKQRIEHLVPGTTIDPAMCWVQIVQAVTQSTGTPLDAGVVKGQTLLDAGIEEYTGKTLPAGVTRRFLTGQGSLLGQPEAGHYLAALSGLDAVLKTSFKEAIQQYWRALTTSGQTRRELAAEALAEGFRQVLIDSHNRVKITETEYRHIRGMLPPGDEVLADDAKVCGKTLTVSAEGKSPVTLAGIILLVFSDPGLSDLFLYSAATGLRRFSGLEALQEYFSSTTGRFELLHYLPWNEQSLARSKSALTVVINDIELPLFLTCIDSIIKLQVSNLEDAIDQQPKVPDWVAAVIDDALDVRGYIDHRLLRLNGDGRWFDERSRTLTLPAHANATSGTEISTSWLDRVHKLDDDIGLMVQAAPGIEACARDLLNKYLAVFGDSSVDALNVQVRFTAAASAQEKNSDISGSVDQGTQAVPITTVSLISLLLERVSRHRLTDLPTDSVILVTSQHSSKQQATALLRPSLLNDMLKHAHARFPAAYLAQNKTLFGKTRRYRNASLDPAALSCSMSAAQLRLELDMGLRIENDSLHVLTMLEQVLNRPFRATRESFGVHKVEVLEPYLIHDAAKPGVLIGNAFILHQPSNPSSQILFWSGLTGAIPFASLSALEDYLNARLSNPLKRGPWLQLVTGPNKESVRLRVERLSDNRLTLDTPAIEGNFIQRLQQIECQHHYEGIEAAYSFVLRSHFNALLFARTMKDAEAGSLAIPALNVLCVAIQTMLFEAFMPGWIKSATAQDLLTYSDILLQYCLLNDPKLDFLYEIPRLQEYSRERVIKQINVDFPDSALDPDKLNITKTQYIPAPVSVGAIPSALPAATIIHTETLTQYALDHFSSMPGAALTVSAPMGQSLPAGLTPAYLQALVRKLDVGANFQKLLLQKLSPNNADYSTRQKRFIQQVPALVREVAFQMRLEKQLSVTAYDYIESIVSMPDGIARQPVHGQNVVLRPLHLVCAEDIEPDSVSGLYVIGPEDLTQGPVILHAIYHEGFSFKEYADQDSLCQDLRTSSELQALVLQRLEENVRRRYAHGGFTEPHLPWSTESFSDVPLTAPGPVTLRVKPVRGDSLQYFFEDTVRVMLRMAKNQTVTTAQADWKSFTYLMTLGAELGMSFLPGRLGTLVAIWQSHSLIQEGVTSVIQQRWGKAFSELSAALAMLATSKQPIEEVVEEAVEESTSSEEHSSFPLFSWGNGQLTPELKARLKQLEAADVSLSQLNRDELFNLYENPVTGLHYAAVAGVVYQVKRFGDQWSIVSGETKGPNIKINEQQQWELDVKWGLAGGGGIVTKIKAELTDDEVEEVFFVEAAGMAEIRTSYRKRAVLIAQAHLQAKRYLENCLDNLNSDAPGTALDSRTNKVFNDFFGVQAPDEQLINKVRDIAAALYAEVMDASLSPVSSTRYVVGTNKLGNGQVTAFVLKKDPLRRIYLTERFFRIPQFRLKPLGPADTDFDVGDHYRAIALLHELSHLVNNTHDIAYLEAAAPFLDMLADNLPYRARLKSELGRMQRFLSHQTPPDQLFKRLDADDKWQDIKAEDGYGKKKILKITGKPNLAEAREVFFADADKRSDIILSNADSVALLMTKLGRRRYISTTV